MSGIALFASLASLWLAPPAPSTPPRPVVAPAAPSPPANRRAAVTRDVAVKRPVRLEVSSFQVAVVVRPGTRDKVRVVADVRSWGPGDGGDALDIDVDGDVISIDGLDSPHVTGSVTVEIPPGSRLEVDTVSGRVDVTGSGGRAEVESVSGAVKIGGFDEVDVDSVSGSVQVDNVVRLDAESVSARVAVTARGAAPKIDVETVSGEVSIAGACAAGCRIGLESLSGRATLALDRKSSFDLRFETFSGSLDDKLGLGGVAGHPSDDGKETSGRLGRGEGQIMIESFSGAVRLSPR